ncbi:hypothetical protein [Nocardia terpenica]|uniref:Uncharacterized protein n=1 Tax=Nocardia terpenica TaxID=455432 RepID=A0A164IPD3_9NOCA|nr:hypothetical protein [Nocardia terpenica]KZM69625.1 hypothetical protein AWN90_07540 [Nocardia terpenica]NQE89362.1 hypothetical protein [Nocardia terpenica]
MSGRLCRRRAPRHVATHPRTRIYPRTRNDEPGSGNAGAGGYPRRLAEATVVLVELRAVVVEQFDHADALLTQARQDWRGAPAQVFGGVYAGWQAAAARLRGDLDRIYAAAVAEFEALLSMNETDDR